MKAAIFPTCRVVDTCNGLKRFLNGTIYTLYANVWESFIAIRITHEEKATDIHESVTHRQIPPYKKKLTADWSIQRLTSGPSL